MAVRRFGPTRAAGTRIEEQEGDKTITQAALGWAGYAGIFERGPVNKMTLVSAKALFQQRYGGVIADSLAPDCALDYYDNANGAGGIAVIRVTDGTELQSTIDLYGRRPSVGFIKMGQIKAANGGRWGGKHRRFSSTLSASTDLTNTTLQLPIADSAVFKQDELKGGYIELAAVANKRYTITGNSAGGLITVASDSTMKTDWGAGPSLLAYLNLDNDNKQLAVKVTDGEENPDTEFSVEVFLDGSSVKKFGNLNTDPASSRYWVNLINNDDSNDFIFAVDLWTGAQAADVRPMSYYGKIATITTTVLTATILATTVNSAGGGNPTASVGATNDTMLEQVITVTMSSPTAGTAVSDRFGSVGAVTLGSPVTSTNKWIPPFTVTAGTSPLANGDTVVLNYRPFRPGKLVGGYVYPDKVNNKRDKFRIIANDHKTLTVDTGANISSIGAVGEEFAVETILDLWGGRDGNVGVVDTTYTSGPWSPSSSFFNDIDGQNLGLVKFATPGNTSTAVQKAGIAYAEAKNHQYRGQFPSNITTETGALAYVNDTIGRSDYSKWSFPSEGTVPDPDPAAARENKVKTVPLTGQIHGREASIARDFDGYHKAAAGVDATLPRCLNIPTGSRKLDEELLNPAGINVIKKKSGNFVLWGDRTPALDPAWKFAHQREQMSHYEHVLMENFDWIIFSINDADSDDLARTALEAYFRPEWVKRALRGQKFEDAATIKVDAELNTDAVRAAGDKIASVTLRLADTTERFIIRIGKAGLFEAVA